MVMDYEQWKKHSESTGEHDGQVYQARKKFAIDSLTPPNDLATNVWNHRDEVGAANDLIFGYSKDIEQVCAEIRMRAASAAGVALHTAQEFEKVRKGLSDFPKKPMGDENLFDNFEYEVREYQDEGAEAINALDTLIQDLQCKTAYVLATAKQLRQHFNGTMRNATYIQRIAKTLEEWGDMR